MGYISKRRFGLLIYLSQEGRGINIINKILAYQLQSEVCDIIEAKEILSDLKIMSVNLMTNSPDKLNKLQNMGVM